MLFKDLDLTFISATDRFRKTADDKHIVREVESQVNFHPW